MAVAEKDGTYQVPGHKGNFRVRKGSEYPDGADFTAGGAAPAKGKKTGKKPAPVAAEQPAEAAAQPGPAETTEGQGPSEKA